MNFIVSGTTDDEPIANSLEGELEWIEKGRLKEIKIFDDIVPILEKLLTLKNDEMFVGKAEFDGKFGLLDINMR